ncbi:polyketide cyclase [Sinomonas atrocyanea]|uniref:Polyketide cyclase n=1 Tax=Sinomonas atrocyanea TaxID=37927 RepID=A0A127A4I6_9MICC|nr:SRPBCC domain-containing protein [Sinomonas atrocyanea]AMM34057.1 polyketide cyclase [Sinomonas atrocyanea]GEB65429.1 activator of HSP90 ATPase [Sinomonas atrocyanea]GGG76139.1 activator of HSP90 ATPase [Sinomonas atrocyanea]
MTFVSSTKDTDSLTLTLVTEFAAAPARVWQVWEDPRQLERWWGPPTWPATFATHDFTPGGLCHYFMTGPGGERAHGWWRFVAIDEPRRLEIEDGFANEDGSPMDPEDTTRFVVTLDAVDGGTRMTTVSRFRSLEQLERMAEMGMEEGMKQASGQIDAILAESTEGSAPGSPR